MEEDRRRAENWRSAALAEAPRRPTPGALLAGVWVLSQMADTWNAGLHRSTHCGLDRSIMLMAVVAVVGHPHHLSLSSAIAIRIHVRGADHDCTVLTTTPPNPHRQAQDGGRLERSESWAGARFVASREGRLRLARAWGPAPGMILLGVVERCELGLHLPHPHAPSTPTTGRAAQQVSVGQLCARRGGLLRRVAARDGGPHPPGAVGAVCAERYGLWGVGPPNGGIAAVGAGPDFDSFDPSKPPCKPPYIRPEPLLYRGKLPLV